MSVPDVRRGGKALLAHPERVARELRGGIEAVYEENLYLQMLIGMSIGIWESGVTLVSVDSSFLGVDSLSVRVRGKSFMDDSGRDTAILRLETIKLHKWTI